MYTKNAFSLQTDILDEMFNFFFFRQDTENLESKCTSVIPTEVIFKKDGSEYTLSSKGIYIN